MNNRKKIEQYKAELEKKIASDFWRYKSALLRIIYREYQNSVQKSGKISMQKFAANLQKKLKIPKNIQAKILTELKATQKKIAEIWDEYFSEIGEKTGNRINDYEKMLAVYSVDFPNIEKPVAKKVIKEVRKSVAGDYGFKEIRKKLVNTGLGYYTAENLARTSLAQFDNAYHTEIAQQAGAEYFLYDGHKSKNSRDFCIRHVGRVYTIAELSAMNNGQGLPVETSLGGYRCQHWLTALINYNRKVPGELYTPLHHDGMGGI